jgi:hypothetical protein
VIELSLNISFKNIYTKAIGLFDDPKLTIAYNTNLMQFYKLMYTYLQNSISLFNNPLSAVRLLGAYNEPNGQMEVFIGDGQTKEFVLDEAFEIRENSIYQYIVNGNIVNATLDKNNRKIIFPQVVEKDTEASVEQYFIGEFKSDFDATLAKPEQQMVMVGQVQDILARLLVKSWGENTRNFLLDIQNILMDSDFKLHSASSALNSKNAWLDQLDQEILQYQNKLAWNLKMLSVK